ncbi:transporter [Actimicrobium antarcticum]|uniref:Transporter n=1 Tax=Actimicrobium antarcticum TaxID=1051899 RepID=A0ABP7T5M5_9BURK
MKPPTSGSFPVFLLATSLGVLPAFGWCADAVAESGPATASQRATSEQAQTVQRLQQRVDRLERQLNDNAKLGAISGRGPGPGPGPVTSEVTAGSSTTVGTPDAPVDARASANRPPAPERLAAASATGATGPVGSVQGTAITSTQGIPLFENRFSFEQGLTYTHYDKRSLVLSGFLALDAILLGKVNLQQIRTDQFQYDLTGRWNLSEQFSADVNLPVVYRNSTYISPGAGSSASAFSDGSINSKSVGDINAGVYFQLPKRAPSDLDWIVSTRLKAPTGRDPFGIKLRENTDPNNNNLLIPTRQPTGNGVWATTFGMSMLKVTDPMVLFANLGYTYNFKRGFSDLSSSLTTSTPGDVKLGNVWSLGAGFALALNEKTSVSFSYAQSLQQVSRLRPDGGNWVRQVGSDSNSVSFNTGLTHQLTPRLSMVGTVSMGLTPDAPDVSVGVKFPYSF